MRRGLVPRAPAEDGVRAVAEPVEQEHDDRIHGQANRRARHASARSRLPQYDFGSIAAGGGLRRTVDLNVGATTRQTGPLRRPDHARHARRTSLPVAAVAQRARTSTPEISFSAPSSSTTTSYPASRSRSSFVPPQSENSRMYCVTPGRHVRGPELRLVDRERDHVDARDRARGLSGRLDHQHALRVRPRIRLGQVPQRVARPRA